MKEIWKPVPGLPGVQVSNLGRARKNGNSFPYTSFALWARRILLAFVGPAPEGKPLALHWDDVPSNNCLSNLRWGDRRDNSLDAIRNGRLTPAKNWHHTPEIKALISQKLKGTKKPPGFGALVSKRCKGQKLSLEHRRKLSESHKGYIPTDEARKNMSIAQKAAYAAGRRTTVFGTPAHKLHLSKLYKGRKLSETTKQKVSDGLRRAYAEGRKR